jgi:hypothetical protein
MGKGNEVSLIGKIGIVMFLCGCGIVYVRLTIFLFSSGPFIENITAFLLINGFLIMAIENIYYRYKSNNND